MLIAHVPTWNVKRDVFRTQLSRTLLGQNSSKTRSKWSALSQSILSYWFLTDCHPKPLQQSQTCERKSGPCTTGFPFFLCLSSRFRVGSGFGLSWGDYAIDSREKLLPLRVRQWLRRDRNLGVWWTGGALLFSLWQPLGRWETSRGAWLCGVPCKLDLGHWRYHLPAAASCTPSLALEATGRGLPWAPCMWTGDECLALCAFL